MTKIPSIFIGELLSDRSTSAKKEVNEVADMVLW